MPKGHLSDNRIIELLVTSDSVEPEEARAGDRAHLAACVLCTGRSEEYQRVASTLGHAAIWDQRTISVQPLREWLRRITAVMHRIHDEWNDADEILQAKLKGPSATWRANLALVAELQSIGMIDSLVARAEASFAGNPTGAVDLAALAVEIADELRIDAYPFDLVVGARARAYREHAYALYYVGQFPDALRAVDRAEELFRQLPVHEFDLARAALIRASIYRTIDRLPEAIDLTRKAAETFQFYDDRERYAKARLTEGLMLIHRRAVSEALAVWLPLEKEDSLRRDATFGMLLQNIGICYRDTGDLARARDYFQRAIEEHEGRGATAEVVRTRWSLAGTTLAAGQPNEALPLLRRVWKDFQDLHIESDAALVALEVTEVLLIIDQPEEVPAICRTLLDQFTRSGMTSRAVTALAYLREAVVMGNATPALVRHVHDFIRDIPKHPTRSFAPPQR